MDVADQPKSVGLSGHLLLYSRPEPLTATAHGKLGLKRSTAPFGFAARQHLIPLQVAEFGPAAANFPIIFAGPQRTPVAAMGLREGQNLFIDAHGSFRVGAYVPSFLRRYPFAAARLAQDGRSAICIDRDSDLWTENEPDAPLFDNGRPTAFTKSCVEFCRQFEADSLRSQAFVKLLNDLDLFELKRLSLTRRQDDGSVAETQPIGEYFAVSEAKLDALPADQLARLRSDRTLMRIYAHMNSQLVWDRLIAESTARGTDQSPMIFPRKGRRGAA